MSSKHDFAYVKDFLTSLALNEDEATASKAATREASSTVSVIESSAEVISQNGDKVGHTTISIDDIEPASSVETTLLPETEPAIESTLTKTAPDAAVEKTNAEPTTSSAIVPTVTITSHPVSIFAISVIYFKSLTRDRIATIPIKADFLATFTTIDAANAAAEAYVDSHVWPAILKVDKKAIRRFDMLDAQGFNVHASSGRPEFHWASHHDEARMLFPFDLYVMDWEADSVRFKIVVNVQKRRVYDEVWKGEDMPPFSATLEHMVTQHGEQKSIADVTVVAGVGGAW